MSAARTLLDRYCGDPVAFCREVLRFRPWSRQVEILEAVRDCDRVAVKACHASGKTAAASAAVAWWLTGGPGSVVVTTAPTERQVKKVLWREIATRYRASRGFFADAALTDTELFIEPGWFAAGFSTDEAEAFQGFHGSRVLVVVDEASGVYEVVQVGARRAAPAARARPPAPHSRSIAGSPARASSWTRKPHASRWRTSFG